MSVLEESFGGILHAPCGQGKTVMGLEIARRLNRRTCVLVHKTFLMDQWKDRIEEFLPDAKVGVWQRDKVPDEDCDFVIAMVQSLTSNREYPQELYDSFGTIITDEVHRFAAPTWQSAIVQFGAKFRLGLTATPNRRDGMQCVFFKHIGPLAHSMPRTEQLNPTIHKIELSTYIPAEEYKFRWNGEVNTGKLISLIAEDDRRTVSVLHYAVRAAAVGRKILILTERRKHVDIMHMSLAGLFEDKEWDDMLVSKYVGGMKQEELDEAAKAEVIVATYQMAQEGLDIPDLDTLLLATPKTSVTQAVGRILRDHPEKQEPVVLDFVDARIDVLGAYWGSRRKKYAALGYL